MKTNITDTKRQLEKLGEAFDLLQDGPSRYRCESGDPLRNAQRNLEWRMHYVNDDTLRLFRSRVLAAHDDAGGLLFLILTSDATDSKNRRRVFRVVAFDVWGNAVHRDNLEDAATTAEGARKRFAAFSMSLTDYYRAALAARRDTLKRTVSELDAGLRKLGRPRAPKA